MVNVKKFSNKELLAEQKRMKTGRYINVRFGKKTWSQLIRDEIKRRRRLGKIKRSAGKRKRSRGLFSSIF